MEKFHEQPKKVIAARIVELSLLASAGISMGTCANNINHDNTSALKSALVASVGLVTAGGLKYGYLSKGELDPNSQDLNPILEEPPPSDQTMTELQVSQTVSLLGQESNQSQTPFQP